MARYKTVPSGGVVNDHLVVDMPPSERASNTGCLPMSFAEYLNLLDWTGRPLHDSRGDSAVDCGGNVACTFDLIR